MKGVSTLRFQCGGSGGGGGGGRGTNVVVQPIHGMEPL